MTLTTNEQKVFDALKHSASLNGGDFGFVEDLTRRTGVLGLTKQQIGALITTLQTKGLIEVHEAVTTDSGRWTQVTSDLFREE